MGVLCENVVVKVGREGFITLSRLQASEAIINIGMMASFLILWTIPEAFKACQTLDLL